MGTMLAFLQSSGTVPEFNEFWNIFVIAGASSSAAVFRINVGIVSGPLLYMGLSSSVA